MNNYSEINTMLTNCIRLIISKIKNISNNINTKSVGSLLAAAERFTKLPRTNILEHISSMLHSKDYIG